jgi:hypothetical protein
MATREDIRGWVIQALRANGGRAKVVEVARHIWDHHEAELRSSGDLFLTWQYDMRWAALILRKSGQMKPAATGDKGTWALV